MAISDWAEIRQRSNLLRAQMLDPVAAGVGESIDRLQAARMFREKLKQERNLRDAAIRVKTEAVQAEKADAGKKEALIAAAAAGRLTLDQAVASGIPEAVEGAATFQDFQTIPTLDAEGVKKYRPLTQQGRILWENRAAAAESAARYAEGKVADEKKATEKRQADEAEEVQFGKIRTALKGQKFTTLGEAVDFLEGGDVAVPTSLFPKVKEYVVSERQGQDLVLRREANKGRAEAAAVAIDLARKRFDLAEKAFTRAKEQDAKAEAARDRDDARADLGQQFRQAMSTLRASWEPYKNSITGGIKMDEWAAANPEMVPLWTAIQKQGEAAVKAFGAEEAKSTRVKELLAKRKDPAYIPTPEEDAEFLDLTGGR